MTDWIPLGELGEIVAGSTPSTHVKEYWNGDIPWITPADLTNFQGVFFTGELRKITEAGYDSCSTKMLPAGSIIYSTRAPIGHCTVNAFPLCTNQGFKSIIPNENFDAIYGYYALRFLTPQIVALGRGATFGEVNKEIFESIRIPLPPLPEQRRIAALLDKADHLRRTRRYAAQLSDTFLQAVFVRMFGDPVRNPLGWQLERLAEVLELPPQYGLYVPPESYSSDPKEGIEMVHMSDLFYGIVERGLLKRVKSDVAGLEAYHVDHSDLLIARRSLNYEGAAKPCRIPKSDAPLLFESSMLRIRPDRKKMHPIYLYHYLADERARIAHVQKFVTRSTISGINQSNLCDVEVLCPPLALQQKFARVVQQFERLRTQQREAERQAEHLFQTLLHRAFSGEG